MASPVKVRTAAHPRPSLDQTGAVIAAAAKRWNIDPEILMGVFGVESDFGRNIGTSSAGAQGYFQFEPATARKYGVNVYSFPSSANGAAHYLHDLGAKKGDTAATDRALNGYSGGGGANYIKKVRDMSKSWSQVTGPGGSPNLLAPSPSAATLGLDPAGAVGDAVKGLVGWTEALGKILGDLLSPSWWLRVFKIVAGGILILYGMNALLKTTFGVSPGGAVVGGAKKAAMVAA